VLTDEARQYQGIGAGHVFFTKGAASNQRSVCLVWIRRQRSVSIEVL
jgi:hypothetical protein